MSSTTQTRNNVRTLIHRDASHPISTVALSAFLANLVINEYQNHSVADSVVWVMTAFDVVCPSGDASRASHEEIAKQIHDAVEEVPEADDELLDITNTIHNTLTGVFGHRIRVTGWFPGQRIVDNDQILMLTGKGCPNCGINPIGVVQNEAKHIRCLNSEDCGWKA